MKSHKKIMIAFFLNLFFSVIEFVGGAYTGSVAIISDAIHDFGDCISIGFSYLFEKISKKPPDNKYTYGYMRYSVLGSIITVVILLVGSALVIYNAILRILNPITVNYDGMIIIAIIGTVINFAAAYFTRDEKSLNLKAVNLHMLEDVLGWAIVLIGAIVMKITSFNIIDPILSLAVSVFIFIKAAENLKIIIDIFLEKTPGLIDIEELRKKLCEINHVLDVHHIHIRSIDGFNHYATLHVVTSENPQSVKKMVKEELKQYNIVHVVVEIENADEKCEDINCLAENFENHHYHHSHHHHK